VLAVLLTSDGEGPGRFWQRESRENGGKLMIRVLIAVAALAVGATTVIAQQENIAAKRNAIMKQSGKAMYGVIGGINRGASPYDQAAVDTAFNDLDAAAKQYVTLFPANALTSVSESNFVMTAKAAGNVKDLEAKAAASAKLVADNKGKVKDLDGLKAAFTAINDGCNACHNDYRAKK
jgi:cytochrome c556